MNELKINKEFAERYDKYRKKEELQRLKDKYGDAASSESSSSEEEDLQLEEEFFEVLSKLKRKDPEIYDKSQTFFPSLPEEEPKVIEKKSKPFLLRDYERKVVLEKGGVYEHENVDKPDKSYVGELEGLKRDLITATKESDCSGGEFLTVKQKTPAARNDLESKLSQLDDHWTDPSLDAEDKYLRDYLLGEKYKDASSDGDSGNEDGASNNEDNEDNEDNELFVMKQEKFEHKYNFRFQEPDSEFVKSYPRTIRGSVRRESKTKRKRQERREKKEKEKKKREEELKRLKQLKREEMLAKVERLQEASGTKVKFEEGDLEEEFDPSGHDERMKDLFDEEFYSKEEMEKPTFSEDLQEDFQEDSEDWDHFECHLGGIPDCEMEDFNMDCDYKPREKKVKIIADKKVKKKSAFYEAVAKKKPVFNPDEKTFDEFLDEYYAMDYEDLVGGIPCRFKYKKVPQNDFGLTTEEILASDNQTLNSWCSLKHVVEQRSEFDEKYWIRKYQNKARTKKRKHFADKPSTSERTNGETPVARKKLNSHQRRRKKERGQRLRALSNDVTNDASTTSSRKEKEDKLQRLSELHENRLAAYGVKAKKIIKKVKYG